MQFKIPFTRSPLEKQKKTSKFISKRLAHKKNSNLQKFIDACNISMTREEYLGICLKNLLFSFVILLLILLPVLLFMKIKNFILIALIINFMVSGFVFFIQLNYPRIYSKRRENDIEKNLMPALEDMLVQLNSGIPLFSIMVNISYYSYGELSVEFKKAIKKIHAGVPEEKVLEEMGDLTSSVFFKRTLWQISNGMKAGSDMSIVIEDSINALAGEQTIQVQNYGNKLNPLVMFYMLSSVILPALSITFLTIIASVIGLPEKTIKMMFIGVFIFVTFIQIMFLGVIKSARPNLL